MVAGHLQEKKGYYYAVLSYKDADKRRRTKWIASGLPVKGNKKKAEGFLQEQRRSFEIPLADSLLPKMGRNFLQIIFSDGCKSPRQRLHRPPMVLTAGCFGIRLTRGSGRSELRCKG